MNASSTQPDRPPPRYAVPLAALALVDRSAGRLGDRLGRDRTDRPRRNGARSRNPPPAGGGSPRPGVADANLLVLPARLGRHHPCPLVREQSGPGRPLRVAATGALLALPPHRADRVRQGLRTLAEL